MLKVGCKVLCPSGPQSVTIQRLWRCRAFFCSGRTRGSSLDPLLDEYKKLSDNAVFVERVMVLCVKTRKLLRGGTYQLRLSRRDLSERHDKQHTQSGQEYSAYVKCYRSLRRWPVNFELIFKAYPLVHRTFALTLISPP
jgi:hypothetical protein